MKTRELILQNESGSLVERIVLQQGLNFTFRLQSTFPITHAHCFNTSMNRYCFASYQFQMNATAQMSNNCNILLTPITNPSAPITVAPIKVNIMKRDIVGRIEFLNVNNSWNSIFQNYKIQGIQVLFQQKCNKHVTGHA